MFTISLRSLSISRSRRPIHFNSEYFGSEYYCPMLSIRATRSTRMRVCMLTGNIRRVPVRSHRRRNSSRTRIVVLVPILARDTIMFMEPDNTIDLLRLNLPRSRRVINTSIECRPSDYVRYTQPHVSCVIHRTGSFS